MNVFNLFETKDIEDIKLGLQAVKSLSSQKEFEEYFKRSFIEYEDIFNNIVCVFDEDPFVEPIKNYLVENNLDLSKLDSEQISFFLCVHPQLINKFDISKLEGNGIHRLLIRHPQLINNFNLGYLNNDEIFRLLRKHPQLKSHFNNIQNSVNTIKTNLIVAVSTNGVIGGNNKILWKLSDDLKFFKEKTLNHAIIMGRKTFDSLPKLLPQRKHIVISQNARIMYGSNYYDYCYYLEGAISRAKVFALNNNQKEIFIIGGGQIYKESLEKGLVDTIYLTQVHTEIDGDTYLTGFDISKYNEIERISYVKNDKNEFDFDIITFNKK